MADSNNILNRPFGLNIRVPERTLKQAQETATSAVNIFAPVTNYFDDNEKVFNGDVAKEIDKYNRMMYNLGAVMRDGQPETTFQMKG